MSHSFAFAPAIVFSFLSLCLVSCGGASADAVPRAPQYPARSGVAPAAGAERAPADSDSASRDAGLIEAVRAELGELGGSSGCGPSFVEVAASRGVVILEGTVPTLLHARLSEERTATVRGVRSIVNRLRVAPSVISDEVIAERINTRLREDPATSELALEARVQFGQVELEGRAHSFAQKARAADIARAVRGVREVNNGVRIVSRRRSDREIQRDVTARLAYDAFLSDDPIAASVNRGVVSLSGSVGTLMEKRRAQSRAQVSGVREVQDAELRVNPKRADEHQRRTRPSPSDEQITEALRHALELDPRVPPSVRARVEAGVARLTGSTSSLISKLAAEENAANTLGVWRVDNRINVSPPAPPVDSVLAQRARTRVEEEAGPVASRLAIDASSGRLTVRGELASEVERSAVLGAVRAMPGVVEVSEELRSRPPAATAPSDAIIERRIERALWWDPRIDDSWLTVEVDDGVATIRGHVPNRALREVALDNVRQARPRRVEDRLEARAR